MSELEKRLTRPGPKRILALDGGGIRGTLSLGFLQRMEQILRARSGNPDLRLSDYFDLIGGTSTGSIIAASLAIGHEVSTIKRKYLELGGEIFSAKRPFFTRLKALYRRQPLMDALRGVFGDRTLGDPSIKTGLCIFAKRADTHSTWTLMNNPAWQFYDDNRQVKLWEAIRASTAAPTLFAPEKVDVGNQYGAFVDGSISMVNNPALQLFLVATLKGYGFNWKTGEDNLLVFSIGTGKAMRLYNVQGVLHSKIWRWAVEIPRMLMEDANWQNQLILQYLSNSPTAVTIDRATGDLSGDLLAGKPLISYLRYDVDMDAETLEKLGLSRLVPKLKSLQKIDKGENRFDLATIGEAAAKVYLQPEHLPAAFDLFPESPDSKE